MFINHSARFSLPLRKELDRLIFKLVGHSFVTSILFLFYFYSPFLHFSFFFFFNFYRHSLSKSISRRCKCLVDPLFVDLSFRFRTIVRYDERSKVRGIDAEVEEGREGGSNATKRIKNDGETEVIDRRLIDPRATTVQSKRASLQKLRLLFTRILASFGVSRFVRSSTREEVQLIPLKKRE